MSGLRFAFHLPALSRMVFLVEQDVRQSMTRGFNLMRTRGPFPNGYDIGDSSSLLPFTPTIIFLVFPLYKR